MDKLQGVTAIIGTIIAVLSFIFSAYLPYVNGSNPPAPQVLTPILETIPGAKDQHEMNKNNVDQDTRSSNQGTQSNQDTTAPGEDNTPTVEIIPSGTQGVVPATFQFQAEVSGGTEPYTYTWDFADGSVEESNEQSISHTFESTGTYDVVVDVRDSGDQTAESNPVEINVVEEGPPEPPCPEGQVLEDGECVDQTVVDCEEGQVLEDGECVEPPEEPPGGGEEGELREEPPVNDTG
jgi:PKD repeat protein